MNLLKVVLPLWCVAAAVTTAYAADLPGSKDPPDFKRFEGSEIIHYATKNYDQYLLARGEGTVSQKSGFEKSERVEGAILRIIYRMPEGHSALEVFRNYERMLSALGLEQTFEIASGNVNWLQYFADCFLYQAEQEARAPHESNPFKGSKNPYYVTMVGTRDGQEMTVAVFVVESDGTAWAEPNVNPAFEIKPGQVILGLDVVTPKPLTNSMVLVKAETMAKALADSNKVDIYGILFDVDKTDLKPESSATLEQVAKLLKDDPTLKLEVAGHTDNTGGAEHNMKLSQGRAAAVVQALVTSYGIDSARLQSQGYGDTQPVAPNDTEDGRAKNRRVELRKL